MISLIAVTLPSALPAPYLLTLLLLPILLLLLYTYVLHPLFLSPLSRIPRAHFTSPLSTLYLTSLHRTRTLSPTLRSLHARLGPIILLSPREISLNTPTSLSKIYTSSGGGFERYSGFYQEFENYGGVRNLITLRDGGSHARQKRVVAGVYAKSAVQGSGELRVVASRVVRRRFLPIVRDYVRGRGKEETEVEVLELAKAVTMDLVSGYIFGSGQGMDFLGDEGYRRTWLREFRTFQGMSVKQREGHLVERSCMEMCEAAEEYLRSWNGDGVGGGTRPVVYEQLSRRLDVDASPSGFSEEAKREMEERKKKVVASELLDHLIAGHESTGVTLMYTMYQLSLRPELQAKLREELLTLEPPILLSKDETVIYPKETSDISNPQTSSSSNSDPDSPTTTTSSVSLDAAKGSTAAERDNELPTPRAIDALPLLGAILQETLRLHQAVPHPQPRVTPSTSSPSSPPSTSPTASSTSLSSLFPSASSTSLNTFLSSPSTASLTSLWSSAASSATSLSTLSNSNNTANRTGTKAATNPPSRSTTLEGYNIPAGIRVHCNAYTLHRNEEVFPAPESWVPERWLLGNAEDEAGQERLREMKRWFWAFGSGGRMCLGSHLAVQSRLTSLPFVATCEWFFYCGRS